jgi:hypothetical protein
MKKWDAFGLTYLNTQTSLIGINPDIKLLDLIALTHPEKYAAIENKETFLNDIYQVNKLLQEIYLQDNEFRWHSSNNLEAIDNIIDCMPHLRPSPKALSHSIDLMIFPGSTGVLMSAIAATAREQISKGMVVKNIAVLGCEQAWKSEWVKEAKTIFSLRPDLLKKDIVLDSIDFEKSYTEHGVNKLISQLMDLGDSTIHVEYLPVPMKTLRDGKIVKPNTDDEAAILYAYYCKLRDAAGIDPVTAIVSTKGFHVRQSYSYMAAGIPAIEVLMSDPVILGEECKGHFSHLLNPNTRAKLDNLAKTIYQTMQSAKIIYPQLVLPQVSTNPYAITQTMGANKSVAPVEECKVAKNLT